MKNLKTIAMLLVVFALTFTVSAQTAPANAEQKYLEQISEALKKDDFAAAEKAAREIIRINPQSGAGYTFLAAALDASGRRQEAIAAARKALELLPKDSELRQLAEEGLAEMTAAANGNAAASGGQTQPNNPQVQALLNESSGYFKTEQWKKAIKVLEKAAALDSSNEKVFYDLGSAYYNNRQFTKSRNAYRRVLEINPNNPNAKKDLADAEESMRKEKAAQDAAWASLGNAGQTNAATSQTSSQSNASSSGEEETLSSGAKASGGLWRGTISNSYTNQKISFRVSADGKTITDVLFEGYLRCRNTGIQDTQLAPLRNVAVSDGAFDDTQLNGGAQVRFDFNGTFTSATTASGTYRVMSGTDCDTCKLEWTASRVGQ